MALQNSQVQASYLAASRALLKILGSPDASAAEASAAREEHRRLTKEFAGKAIKDIGARTHQFQIFVEGMEHLLAQIKTPGIAGLRELSETLRSARALLEATVPSDESE